MKYYIRYLFGVMLCLFFVSQLSAQQINYAEYFFDNDPGRGNGIPLSVSQANNIDANFSIPTASLSAGTHQLYIRTRTTDGKWSLNAVRMVYINPVYNSSLTKIVAGEYFINSDPGFGNGISFSFLAADTVSVSKLIATNSLNSGVHVVYVRFKNGFGHWSLSQRRIFFVTNNNNIDQLVAAEYFIDNDPGIGNANSVSVSSGNTIDITHSLSVSSLNSGLHFLNFRVKDAAGKWSLSNRQLFYVSKALSSKNLVAAEYFYDNDPGRGNGVPISITTSDSINLLANLNTSSLTQGIHFVNIRVKDQNGLWSLADRKMFYVLDGQYDSPKLTEAEYFFDTDPGFGNGTKINFASSNTIDLSKAVASSSLAMGSHRFFVRAKDSLGRWSLLDNQLFFLNPSEASSKISAIEYSIDTILPFGQGNRVNFAGVDTLNYSFTFNHGLIDTFYHVIHLRIRDMGGRWSLLDSIHFRLENCIIPTAVFSFNNFCFGDSLILQNNSLDTDTATIFSWDLGMDGFVESNDSVSYVFKPNMPGTYKVNLTVTNYVCIDTAIATIQVFPKPDKNISIFGDTTFCPGAFSVLSANSGVGYLYQWLKNGSQITNATGSFYQATDSGSYQAVITNIYNCSDSTSTIDLHLHDLPLANISFTGSNSICFGDSIQLKAPSGNGLDYQWFKNGTIMSGEIDSSITVNDGGSYKVRISNSTNCSSESNPVVVTVNPLPFVNVTPIGNTVFCQGDSVVLMANSSTGYTYNWFDGANQLAEITNRLVVKTTGNYSLKVTNSSNCSFISSVISTTANPIPTSDFSIPTHVCAFDTVQVQYSGTAGATAFYNWNFGGGTVLNGMSQGPYSIRWNTAGTKNLSLVVSENGCLSSTTSHSTIVNSVDAFISSANNSVCQGDSVLLYANSGQNLSYQWLQGGLALPGAINSSLVVKQSGNYTVKVIDQNLGCSQVSQATTVNIYTTDFNLNFTVSNPNLTQPPFAVVFSNQTPNLSNYQFEWDLGDGNTSTFFNPSHNYAYNGVYTVALFAEHASTGCRDTLIKTNYISCTGGAPNPCNILAAISPAGPVTICGGDSVQLSASAGTGYSYQWVFNNMLIPGATQQNFTAKQPGNYRVIVSNSVCSQTSPAFVLNHFPSIQPIIQATGQLQPCTIDSMLLSLFVNYNSYNWSTGQTTSSIYVQNTGYYQVAVTDNYGCNLLSQPYAVNNSFLNAPDICIVGVDSANNNRLVWERQSNALIDSFYIYREGFIAGLYNKIGAIPYSQISLFVDTNSNPAIQAYRYKIAAVDTCGGVTLLSNHHKTIHLTINAGLNGSWNLIWDGYQGFNFSTYRIYRGTSTNNLTLLTQLPSTATSYTDLNPPSGTVFYQIEVIKSSGCYPDTVWSKANTNYNTSRSNTANNATIAPIYLTAEFSANTQTGIWPIQVQFNDLSTGSPNSWEWDFGDGNSSVVQNPKHTYNNTGLYTVKLKVCNGNTCDTTSKIGYINVLPNGLVEVGVELSAKLYPNPNDGNFTLEINDKSSRRLELHLFNALGEEIFKEGFTTQGHTLKTVNLNTLPKGIYFIHLNSSDKIVYREKIIVQ